MVDSPDSPRAQRKGWKNRLFYAIVIIGPIVAALNILLLFLSPVRNSINPPQSQGPVSPIERILSECYKGEVTFRHPEEMELLKSTSFFARASFIDSTIEPSEGIPGEGDIEQEPASICRTMHAELTGPGFEITPTGGTEARIIPDDGYAQWEWTVTPKEAGARTLFITLYTSGPEGRIGDKTYTRSIEVDVPFSYTAANIVQKWLSPLGITATAVIALMGSAFTWWKVKARKRKPFYTDSWE